jgi:hypothetical protein
MRSNLPNQLELSGTSQDPAGLAQIKANAPLRPSKPQKACDEGLFSDDARQSDLIGLILKVGTDN